MSYQRTLGTPGNGTFAPKLAQYVNAFGADASGAVDSTAAFVAALAALPTTVVNNGTTSVTYPVGTIYLGSGTYKLGSSADIGNLGPFVSVLGPGKNACRLDYRGSGNALRAFNAVRPSDNTFDTMFSQSSPYGLGSRFDGFTIDGTNSSAGASGLHAGDYEGGILGPDLTIQHFNKAGSVGLNLDSTVSWTESWRSLKTLLWDNTTAVRINGSSFAYNDFEFKIYGLPNQDGVVVSGGATVYNGSLRIRGNFGASNTGNTGRILAITGNNGGTTYSGVQKCLLDIQVETNLMADGGNTFGPQTIFFGDPANNKLEGCTGILHFSGGRYAASNWVKSLTNHFGFSGYLIGDDALNGSTRPDSGGYAFPQIPPALPLATVPQMQVKGYYDSASGSIDLHSGHTFDLGQLSGNLTLLFKNGIVNDNRRITIRAQQRNATSNFYDITWPSAGSPSQNNPKVIWDGGIPPLLSRVANSIDVFELFTFDGATWYGKQRIGYAAAPALPVGTYRNRVQSTTATSQTLAPNANTTAGNTLFCFIANTTAGSTATPTVSDGKGNTWTVDKAAGAAGAIVWIAHAVLTTALTTADSVTVAWSASTSATLTIVEVTNLGATPKLDVTGVTDNGTTSAAALTIYPSIPSQAPAEISFAFVAAPTGNVSNPIWTVAGGGGQKGSWTQSNTGANIPTQVAWIQSPAAADQTPVTFTPSVSEPMTAVLATFHA